jgi:hypothetical protein
MSIIGRLPFFKYNIGRYNDPLLYILILNYPYDSVPANLPCMDGLRLSPTRNIRLKKIKII